MFQTTNQISSNNFSNSNFPQCLIDTLPNILLEIEAQG
jgi:hypothetical protein